MIAGASGLVGERLLELLLHDAHYGRVHALVRKPLAVTHRKLVQHPVNFDALDGFDWPAVDDVFCCLGTTIKIAGSQAAFRKVDFTYVLAIAEQSLRAGARRFLMVTAMGANPRSAVFYNRVKGEIEQAVSALPFESVALFRPSFIGGERPQQRRGEGLALTVFKQFDLLIPRKYKVISDVAIARAMIDTAQQRATGVRIIESDQLQAFV